ncbi:hypothetical protein M8J77_026528 [Diaphorina citri]|nr:hypothetical protein M8J77_026528 [Diaphorina citri]
MHWISCMLVPHSNRCVISPILFNVFVEQIIDEAIAKENRGLKINGEIVNNLRYADDTLLIASSEEDLKYLLTNLFQVCQKYGMKINMKKTKVMCVSKKENKRMNVIINGEKLDQVEKYKYLGAEITTDGRCETEIIKRINLTKRAFWNHKDLMKSGVNIHTKLRLLKTYMFSVFSYGSEAWTINKQMSDRITSLENWCYRRMLKISWTEKISNVEVLRRIQKRKFELLTMIKKRKLRYAGHILRGSNGTLLPKIIEGRIEGKRDRGRQRRTWMDDIKEWTNIPTYGAIKRLAQDRAKWREMIEEI